MDEDVLFCMFLGAPLVCAGALVVFVRRRKQAARPAGWVDLLIGNTLILLIFGSAVVLAGEIYFRFFYDSTDALGYTKVSKRWYQRHWKANSIDCRDDRDYSKKVAPGQTRITFLGDSFTAGHGINNIEDRFANRLRALEPGWDVNVLAQPGFDTGNEIAYLEGFLNQGYQINEVVLVYCLNDVADMFPEWNESVGRIRQSETTANWLVQNGYLLNTLYYRINVSRSADATSYFDYIKRGYGGELWQRQKRRLKSLKDLVEAHGGHLSVVTFPFMHALGPTYEFKVAHEELDSFWKDLGVPHLDLLAIYRDLPPGRVTVSKYDGHPNTFANALATEAIDKFLKACLGASKAQR